ncbi:NAD-dependent epimerase/dehydratase family protein [Candidatus Omnitrophota bacterium]
MTDRKPLILVTGGAGYVGSTLIRHALAVGYRVRCLDLLVYGGKSIAGFINHPDFEFVKGDIRNKSDVEKSLEAAEAVVHLAAIVGDGPCQVAPKSAYQINFQGTQLLADLSKKKRVSRFVFASTCSNYGIIDGAALIDETRKVSPVSLYAETKVDCEDYLTLLADKNFNPTILRFATAFGVSFRTRFDLLVNSFVYEALSKDKLVVFAAKMWRPYVHVSDMSTIILKILNREKEKVGKQVFNAGATSQNYTKEDVVEMIVKSMPSLKIHYATDIDDKRNYRVDFTKLEKTIGFTPTKTVKDGINELILCFRNNILTDADYETNNLERLKEFIDDALQGKLPTSPNPDYFKEYIYRQFHFPREKPSALFVAEGIADLLKNNRPREFKPLYDSSSAKHWIYSTLNHIPYSPELVMGYMYMRDYMQIKNVSGGARVTYLPWNLKETSKAWNTATEIITSYKEGNHNAENSVVLS